MYIRKTGQNVVLYAKQDGSYLVFSWVLGSVQYNVSQAIFSTLHVGERLQVLKLLSKERGYPSWILEDALEWIEIVWNVLLLVVLIP